MPTLSADQKWPALLQHPMRNHANIEGGPAQPFDNISSGPTSAIDLVTVPEAAALLRISISGVRRLQQARQLPFIKVGGGVRFARGDLVSYLTKRRIAPLEQ